MIHETDMNVQNATVMATAAFATQMTDTKTTDYVGNKIYENNQLKRILVDGGYIEDNQYHFYLTDHLGNNRIVAKADGSIVQKTHYYPFGMAYAESTGQEKQPYKYNGKELDNVHGLNLYDYSARYMEPGIGRFTSVDPMAEKYYSWSPYVYVLNNPLRNLDPTGEDVFILYYTEGNNSGDDMFKAAAQTRKDEIESRKKFNSERDIVIMHSIKDISNIKSLTEKTISTYSKQFGKTAEVGIWSHAGLDGPVGTKKTSVAPLFEDETTKQMEIKGGWDNIDFNWKKEGASMDFYGCNTGVDSDGSSFAQKISKLDNMKNVEVSGQQSYAYPSINAYYRATSLARTTGIYLGLYPTYLVGGNRNEGGKALIGTAVAKPMNHYVNGELSKVWFQKTN